jgi:hypothetical protein
LEQVVALAAAVDMALRTLLVVREVLVLPGKAITVAMEQFGPAAAEVVAEQQVLRPQEPQAQHLLVQVELV